MTTLPSKKAVLAGLIARFALLSGVFCLSLTTVAQTNSPAPAKPPMDSAGPNRPPRPARRPAVKQAAVASTNAVFGTVSATDEAYKSALEAHALEDAKKVIGTNGAFKGTVAKLFEPGGMAILEFDTNYSAALTAIVRSTNFSNFPALTNLIGSNVLVMGPVIDFRGKAEMVLEKPEQIKLVR